VALLEATRTKVEAWRYSVAAAIASRQNAYLAAHGRYWQGILTPVAVPVEAADTVPDLTLRPTDQMERWSDFLSGLTVTTIPCSIRIDVYDGPLGQGYTVTVEVVSESSVWIRTYHVGPEDWRVRPWTRIEV
jgi:hypothetical protein